MAMQRPPSMLQEGGPHLHFDKYQSRPELAFRVTADDQLAIGVRNALAGVQVSLGARIWSLDGEFIDISEVITPPADRALRYTFKPMHDGYLVAAALESTGATFPVRGQTYVTLQLIRPPTFAFRMNRWLCADYLSGSTSTGWPWGRTVGSTEGQGALYSILATNPAAGVEWSQIVPPGARWRIRGIRATLVTSAVVANRLPSLVIDDGVNTLMQIESPNPEAAGGAVVYNFIPDIPYLPLVTSQQPVFLPPDLQLEPGWHIKSSTGSLDAADQWSNIRLTIEEWLED